MNYCQPVRTSHIRPNIHTVFELTDGRETKKEHDATEAQPHFPPHHHSTLGSRSSSKTIGTCKRSQQKCSCDPAEHIHTAREYQGSPDTTSESTARTKSKTPQRAQETCRPVKQQRGGERIQARALTFRRHPVFVWTARQAPVVGVQASHVTRAVAARRRTPTLLLVGTRSICGRGSRRR